MRVRSPLPAPVFPLFSRLGAVSFRPLCSRNSHYRVGDGQRGQLRSPNILTWGPGVSSRPKTVFGKENYSGSCAGRPHRKGRLAVPGSGRTDRQKGTYFTTNGRGCRRGKGFEKGE